MGVHLEDLWPSCSSCNAPVPYCQVFAVILQEGEIRGKRIILELFVPLDTDAHPIKIHFCIIITQSSSRYDCCFKTNKPGTEMLLRPCC